MKVEIDDLVHWQALDEVSLAQSCEPHKAGVSKIAVERRRGNIALSGGNDGGLCLLDVRALAEPARAVVKPCLLAAGPLEANCSADELGLGHRGRVEVASWLPEDDRLFVSGGDRCLKVWDASAPGQSVIAVDLRSSVLAGALTKGPPVSAAAALADGTVRIVDLRIGRAVSTMQGHTLAPLAVAWGSAGSHRLFSGGMDGTLRAWDARMGARSLFLCDPYANEANPLPLRRAEKSEAELLKSKGGFAAVRAAQERQRKVDMNGRFQPYVRRTMSGMFSSAKTETGNCGRVFETNGPPSAAAPLATGTACASTSMGHEEAERERLRREKWSRDASERARHFLEPPRRTYLHEASVAHNGAIVSVAFVTPPPPGVGARVISCGVDGKMRTWDADTGSPAGPKEAFDVECWSREVSLQVGVYGRDICVIPEQDKVATYCMKTGRLICHLSAHTAQVTCAEAVGENAEVLSGGEDGRLLCWRLARCPLEHRRRARSEPALNGAVICLD